MCLGASPVSHELLSDAVEDPVIARVGLRYKLDNMLSMLLEEVLFR